MRLPVIVLSLTAAVAAVAPAADAAPKKKPAVCRVSFTDTRADTVFGPAPSTETYDIIGGDLVNRPKEFVATLRLAAAPSASGSAEPASWMIAAGASGVPIEFALRRAAGGGLTSAVTASGQAMTHKYVIAQGTVVWTAQKINSPLARPGVTFTSPNAATKLAALTADAASATATKKCA